MAVLFFDQLADTPTHSRASDEAGTCVIGGDWVIWHRVPQKAFTGGGSGFPAGAAGMPEAGNSGESESGRLGQLGTE